MAVWKNNSTDFDFRTAMTWIHDTFWMTLYRVQIKISSERCRNQHNEFRDLISSARRRRELNGVLLRIGM